MSNDYTPGGGGIDPAMLTQLLQYLIMQGGQGGELSNLLPQGSLDSLSFGYQPSGAAAAMPMIPGTANSRQVGSIEEAGKQANYFQDVANIGGFGDISGALFGLGGYSSDAFAPEVTRELIPRPATQQFNQWLQSAQQGDLSFEGLIASEMQSRGISPRQAVSEMREILQNAAADAESENPSQALQDQAAQIRLWLPNSNMTNGQTGELLTGDAAIDWQQAFSDAEDAFAPYMQEQQTQPGPIGEVRDAQGNLISSGGEIIVGSDGQLYRQTTTDSPLAQQFHEAGIPLPTEQYTPGDLLGAGWQQADAAFQDTLPQITDQLAQYQADIDRANSRAETWSQMPLQEFYDRGSVPGIGGGGTIAGWPTAAAPTPAGPDMVQPIVTNAADQSIIDQALAATNPATIQQIIATHPELNTAQLDQIADFADSQAVALPPGPLADRWSTSSSAARDAADRNRPPPAATQAAVTLATQAQSPGEITPYIPGWEGAANVGTQSLNDALLTPGDTRSYLITHWSSMSQDERDGVEAAIRSRASTAGMGGVPTGPGQVPDAQQWEGVQQMLDQLSSGMTLLEYNQAQGGGTPTPPGGDSGGVGNAGTGIGGGGAGGQGAPRTLDDLGQPGADQEDYRAYRARVEPYETPLPYDRWLAQQQQGWDLDTSPGAYLAGMRPHPDQYAVQSGRMSADQARQPTPPNPNGPNPESTAGYYVHNGAIFDPQGHLVGYMPGAGSNRPNPESTAGQYVHNGAIFDDQDRLIGYTESQRISNFENQRDELFNGGRRGFLEQLWPDAGRKRTAESGRTNAGAQAVLRYGLDTQTSPGHSRQPSGKDRMSRPSTGFNRRDLQVLGFRNDARNAGIRRAQLQDQQTLADRAIHGAAYARARGYADALRQLGITPTSVALANRTGGINAMFGR